MSNEPLDLKKGWMSVARRAQSVAKTGGLAIVTITVLVDESGEPKFWLEPTCKKVEPRKFSSEIMKMFGKGDNSAA